MEKTNEKRAQGVLKRISGPVVTAVGLDAHMYDVVKVGNEELMGGRSSRSRVRTSSSRSTKIPPASDPVSRWETPVSRSLLNSGPGC